MQPGGFDWDNLRIFRILAESGSISAAARRLGESPPTIGRKLDELERTMKAELFSRTTRGIKLTEAGRQARRYVDAMQEAADALYTHVSDMDEPAEGPVTLHCGDGLGPHWVAAHLPEFHLAHPRIQLKLKISETPPDLLAGEADIAIQFAEPKQADLIARKLGTVHYMCFSSRAYIDTYGEPKSLFDFSHHRCIFHEGYVNQVERWPMKAYDLTKLLDFALVTNSGTAIMAACAGGGGIAILPSFAASLDKRLVPLSLTEVMPASFWIVYTERIRRLPRGQIVLDWARSLFDERKHAWFRSTFYHPEQLLDAERTSPPYVVTGTAPPEASNAR